jgi:acyl-CoA dehydrogenase
VSDAELIGLIGDLAKGYTEPDAGELPDCWATLVELGLPLVGIAEKQGGAGGTLADLAVLARALGRQAMSTPLIEVAVASWVLATAGRAPVGLTTVSLDRASAVPWARHASHLVLADGDEVLLAAVDAKRLRRETSVAGEPWDVLDPTSVCAVRLPGAPSVEHVRARLGLLRAAALTGAVAGAYDLTRRYLMARHQFGKPLVRIPAVAANLARIKTVLLQSEAGLARADEADLASVAAARVLAGRAATVTARLSHQLHGAMGVTAEYPLHRYTRRLWAWRDADLDQRSWSILLGRLAAASGESAVWDNLTG